MPYEGLSLDSNPIVSAKTASYQLLPNDCGKIFTNRGASGAIVLTLPAVADIPTGWNMKWLVVADQTVTVTAPSGTLCGYNNVSRTSIAFSTSSEKIGGGGMIVYDGTKYLTFLNIGLETQTPTFS
jgi:hypothetical protein